MDLSLLNLDQDEFAYLDDNKPEVAPSTNGNPAPSEVTNRFDLDKKPAYEIKSLNERHRAIIRMTVAGIERKVIAERLGITEATVTYTTKSPLAQREIAVLRQTLDAEMVDSVNIIHTLQPVAALRMGEILTSSSAADKDVIRVAQDILDRGDKRIRKGNVTFHEHTHATSDDIEEAKRRAKDRAALSGQLVEATVVDETDNPSGIKSP